MAGGTLIPTPEALVPASEALVVASDALALLQNADALPAIVPVLPRATEPILLPVPAGAMKVLPRWSEKDGVTRWRVRYRPQQDDEDDQTGKLVDDRCEWTELELHAFTRELPLCGLLCGKNHFFTVAVNTSYGWSDWSPIASGFPPIPALPAQMASVFPVVTGPDTILVRWTRPCDFAAAVTCAKILRYKLLITWQPIRDDETAENCAREIIIDCDADCCEVGDLQCLREYHFQIAAENVTGWGHLSDPSPAIRVATPVPAQLGAPILRHVSRHGALVQWELPPVIQDTPLEGFRFRYTSEGSFDTGEIHEVTKISPTVCIYLLDSLLPGTSYIFQVAAENRYGRGVWSKSSAVMRTLDGFAPSKISDFAVPTMYSSFIALRWRPVENNGYEVTKYLLRSSHTPEMEDCVEMEAIVQRKEDGFDWTELRHLRKLRYFFQIACVNCKGQSEWSDTVEVDLACKRTGFA